MLQFTSSANARKIACMQPGTNEAIQTHYARAELGDVILAALEEAGKGVNRLTPITWRPPTSFISADGWRRSSLPGLPGSMRQSAYSMWVAAQALPPRRRHQAASRR